MKSKFAEIPAPAAPAFGRRKNSAPDAALSRGGARDVFADDYVHTASSKTRTRDLPTLGLIGVLVIAALVVAAYISNTVTVDNLMRTMTKKDKEILLLVQQREALRAELNLLTSSTRIQSIATQQLGLEHAAVQPSALEVPGYVPRGAGSRVK